MDALVLAAAESAGVELVSFDAELQERDAVAPGALL